MTPDLTVLRGHRRGVYVVEAGKVYGPYPRIDVASRGRRGVGCRWEAITRLQRRHWTLLAEAVTEPGVRPADVVEDYGYGSTRKVAGAVSELRQAGLLEPAVVRGAGLHATDAGREALGARLAAIAPSKTR